MQFINQFLIPIGFCWSLPQYQWDNFIYWQTGFSAILVSLILWRMTHVKRHVETLVIDTDCRRTLFGAHNESGKDALRERTGKLTHSSTIYQLDASSRYTQFCIFLRLAIKNESTIKSTHIYSAVLFKWQLSEADFRFLSASINAGTQ